MQFISDVLKVIISYYNNIGFMEFNGCTWNAKKLLEQWIWKKNVAGTSSLHINHKT